MTIYIDPSTFTIPVEGRDRLLALMAKYNVVDLSKLRLYYDDEGEEMQRIYQGRPRPSDLALYFDIFATYRDNATEHPGFYGLPRMDLSLPSILRNQAHNLQFGLCYYSSHLWPDCSVGRDTFSLDLDRLDKIKRLVTSWAMDSKTIPVTKTWFPESYERLSDKQLYRYAKRLEVFESHALFLPGRFQWRSDSRLDPIEYPGKSYDLSRKLFGDRYTHASLETMISDTLVEIAQDLEILS